jgi:hypothetical protein
VSGKGYTSKPPVWEDREVNRLHAEAVKRQKNTAEATAARIRKRKEKHDKACKIARAEVKPRPATPESTEEEEDSGPEIHFSDDDEPAAGVSSPPVYQGASDEEVPAGGVEHMAVPDPLPLGGVPARALRGSGSHVEVPDPSRGELRASSCWLRASLLGARGDTGPLFEWETGPGPKTRRGRARSAGVGEIVAGAAQSTARTVS